MEFENHDISYTGHFSVHGPARYMKVLPNVLIVPLEATDSRSSLSCNEWLYMVPERQNERWYFVVFR